MRQLLTTAGIINISDAIRIKFDCGENSPTYLSIGIAHKTGVFNQLNIKLKEDYTFKTKQEALEYLKSDRQLACFLRGELGYGATFDLTPYEHEDNFNLVNTIN